MEVIKKNVPVMTEFSEILEGAVFEKCSIYYIKIFGSENYGNLGVNLKTGTVVSFNKHEFVRPVKGKFVEE